MIYNTRGVGHDHLYSAYKCLGVTRWSRPSVSCPTLLIYSHRAATVDVVDSSISVDSSVDSVQLSSGSLLVTFGEPHHRFLRCETLVLDCPASEPLQRVIFGTLSSIFDLFGPGLWVWPVCWVVVGLHGVPLCFHSPERSGNLTN